jgi:hypothetical protein
MVITLIRCSSTRRDQKPKYLLEANQTIIAVTVRLPQTLTAAADTSNLRITMAAGTATASIRLQLKVTTQKVKASRIFQTKIPTTTTTISATESLSRLHLHKTITLTVVKTHLLPRK